MSSVQMPRRFIGGIGIWLTFVAACGVDDRGTGHSNERAGGPTSEDEWFVDRGQETGLDFVHFNGMAGEFYIPENMGPGVGLLDYDNDGDLDVYLVQGQTLEPEKTPARTLVPLPDPASLKGRLFRNDLKIREDGIRILQFTDVTDRSGIDARAYGMGVATGDFNNDGCVDLYLTSFGRNQLFRNDCDGTFSDVSRSSGTDITGWSVSASFVDYDRDGLLDLFVGRYLEYSREIHLECRGRTGEEDYCHPSTYKAQASRLFRNNGNGKFIDVTSKALVSGAFGPALGVISADFNGDGWVDIYVANDSQENQLWMNQRDGTFTNTALLAGVAVTVDGAAEGSMGVDAGDFDNDGDEDLFMTEVTSEGHNLYVNDGSGRFDDRSARSGLGPLSLPYTGFGAAWFDFDNDGWLDILSVNGTIVAIEAQRQSNHPLPQRQQKQLFRNLGNGRFEDVSDRAGAAFRKAEVGRGAAFGDIDNDGDTDVIVGNDSGRTELLINDVGNRKHWIGLRVIGQHGRDMLGARVGVTLKDGSTIWRRARSDGSYASANDPRIVVGIGDSTDSPRVRVQWPNGRIEEWSGVGIDRYTTLEEGSQR